MGGIGRALGAVLMGVGDGLEKQAHYDYQRARDEMQERRAIALENLRHKNAKSMQSSQYDLADRNAGRDAARDFWYNSSLTEQKRTAAIADREDEQAHDREMEGLRSKYRVSEQAADFARRTAQEAKDANDLIVHWEVGPNGEMVGVTKSGVVKRSPPGLATPYSDRRAADDEAEEEGPIARARRERGGGAQPKGNPQDGPPRREWTQADENQLLTRYANANPTTAPRLFRGGKKIPLDEARRMLRGY